MQGFSCLELREGMEKKMSKKAHCPAMLCALFLLICLCLTSCGFPNEQGDSGREVGQERTSAAEWYYDHFDEVHKNAYDAFRKAAEDPFSGELVSISGEKGSAGLIKAAELDSVYQGFLFDHPELFWLNRSYRYRICDAKEETADAVAVMPLFETREETERHCDEFIRIAGELLGSIKTANGSGETSGAVYDLLVSHAAYTQEALYDPSLVNEHTAYGAIVLKSAVCDGYALAYKYLMNRCGIECIVIPGTVNGAAHVWNTAFWDGAWHEMDITWDASNGSGRHYFDLTTKEMETDHAREATEISGMIPVSALKAAICHA